jgi:predicted O-methyltransferase YrrM
MNRHQLLRSLHRQVRPRTYLETGVADGQSMTLSRVPSIGIDPAFRITRELLADVQLARVASDEFFARDEPMAHLPIDTLDLAFVDGMHLAEYALRDYLAVERFTHPASVIVFDDMLPRNVDEAARRRYTKAWTGDVYKAVQALRDFRPDLMVFEVDTAPTGTVVVLVPDAGRQGVMPEYDDWMDVALAPDPQDVPEAVLTRSRALQPEDLLASTGWGQLRQLRQLPPEVAAPAVRAAFADILQ